MTPDPALPAYDDLPPASAGGRSGWGVFGEHDDLGRINLLTPERVAAAAALVRRGAMFPLDAPIGLFAPALATGRGIGRQRVLGREGGFALDDVWDNVYPQAGSQWDSLAHVGYGPDAWYNGATYGDIVNAGRNTIHRWAQHGIAGRAVVLDLARSRAEAGRPYGPGTAEAFDVPDLEAAVRRTGLELRTGDIVLLHTGFGAWYAEQNEAAKQRMPNRLTCPGLEHTEDMARYLWNSGVAVIASDNFSVEVWPADFRPESAPFGFLHQMLIGSLGMGLGELWWLDDLAADCARTGVYEGLLVSSPMNAVGGIGSTANATVLM
jgi:kynurenine formamidase